MLDKNELRRKQRLKKKSSFNLVIKKLQRQKYEVSDSIRFKKTYLPKETPSKTETDEARDPSVFITDTEKELPLPENG